MGLGVARSSHTRQFDARMNNELVFNRCRGHVFSLACLEEFLGAARNGEAVLGINFTPISGPEPSILCQ
eukprot:scaffold82038_cov74-Attheya_sp.AAC.3